MRDVRMSVKGLQLYIARSLRFEWTDSPDSIPWVRCDKSEINNINMHFVSSV